MDTLIVTDYRVSRKKVIAELLDLALVMGACLNHLCRTAHYGRITKGIQAGKNNQCQVKQFRGFLFWDTMYTVQYVYKVNNGIVSYPADAHSLQISPPHTPPTHTHKFSVLETINKALLYLF